jgi:hypothetical protein
VIAIIFCARAQAHTRCVRGPFSVFRFDATLLFFHWHSVTCSLDMNWAFYPMEFAGVHFNLLGSARRIHIDGEGVGI